MINDVVLTPIRPQHRFDEQALKSYLRTHLQDGGCDFSELSIQQFEGGQSNPTFKLRTASRDFVLRKKPPGQLLKSAHQVDREYTVMTALADTRVPVPKTLLLCEDDSIIGTAFYLMENVEGRVLLDTHLPSFEPAQRKALYRSFIESLAALHNLNVKDMGLEEFGRPGNYYARQIHRWSQQYRQSETKKNPAMDAVMAWLPEHIPDSDEVAIVHGDYRLPNCIIHPELAEIVAVIDWELSTIGHPLADLSYWCAAEYHGQKSFPADFEALGLPSEAELIDYYCQLTGRESIDNWTFYLAFNLFRSAAIRQGVYKRGLDGIASSDQWQAAGPGGRKAAVNAWALVKENS